jgi:hypothetical protein
MAHADDLRAVEFRAQTAQLNDLIFTDDTVIRDGAK